MNLSKPFILFFASLLVVWFAGSVQGSDQFPQTGLPRDTLLSRVPVKETAHQVLPPRVSPTTIWAYKIKDGGGGLLSLQKSFHGYFWDTSGRIKNPNGTPGLVDFTYTHGPATPHLYFGYDTVRNNDEWRLGDANNTRMMYGASIDYKVGETFYVIPMFTYYDWGKQPGVVSKPDINREWIGGLQLRFLF